MANPNEKLEVIASGGALGAEIRGVDLSVDPTGGVVKQILEAFHEHQVIFLRDQELSDERLIAIAEWFGPMYVPPTGIPMLGTVDQGFVTNISNVGDDAVSTSATKPLTFHTDLQYMPVPLLGSMLYAHEVPEQGGDTLFSNLYQAYEELDEETKKRIAEVQGVGVNPYAGEFARNHRIAGSNQHYVLDDIPDFPHPLVRTHPVTGRKALYHSMFVMKLLGISDIEHDALRAALWEHVDQDHLYYRHQWRAHDLVIWDNRCTNHKRDPYDPDSRRILHRVQIAGTRPF